MSLASAISALATRAGTEAKSLRTLINGNVSSLAALTTTAKTSLVAAVNELNSNKLSKTTPNVITFTASGTYTPTTGTKLVHVICIGGGGGSGGVGSSAKSGGAGGGAYAESWLSITAVGASKAVTVGAGGGGGASGRNTGARQRVAWGKSGCER